MSKKNEPAPTENNTPEVAKTNTPEYSVERLAKDCYELFGVTASTFAGATCKLGNDKNYTVEEMKVTIKKWLDTPIKPKQKVVKG